MKTENNNSMKPFFSMILTSGVPRLALSAGLTASLVTTLVGLSIPLLTREMVDGFSANSINLALSGILALVFIVQAVCDGFRPIFFLTPGRKWSLPCGSACGSSCCAFLSATLTKRRAAKPSAELSMIPALLKA